MTDGLISRSVAIASAISGRIRTLPTTEDGEDWIRVSEVRESLYAVPSAEPRWIPVKTRPMTEEERWNFEEHTGIQLDDEDAVFFDCKMPEDGQRIWISTIHGNVFEDFCENDGDFLGLEGNGDWLDVTAWMPMFVPEPWKGEDE